MTYKEARKRLMQCLPMKINRRLFEGVDAMDIIALGKVVSACDITIAIVEECNKHLNCEESCRFWNHKCGCGCVFEFESSPNRWEKI